MPVFRSIRGRIGVVPVGCFEGVIFIFFCLKPKWNAKVKRNSKKEMKKGWPIFLWMESKIGQKFQKKKMEKKFEAHERLGWIYKKIFKKLDEIPFYRFHFTPLASRIKWTTKHVFDVYPQDLRPKIWQKKLSFIAITCFDQVTYGLWAHRNSSLLYRCRRKH